MHRLPAALLVLAAAVLPAGATELDDMLSGFADGCRQTEAFVAFRQGLVTDGLNVASGVTVPEALAPAFGAPRSVSEDAEDGSVVVEVLVRDATFRGLPVKALVVGIALDYPLIDDSVVFDAPLEAVEAAFSAGIERFAADNPESIVEYDLFEDPDGPTLACFATN